MSIFFFYVFCILVYNRKSMQRCCLPFICLYFGKQDNSFDVMWEIQLHLLVSFVVCVKGASRLMNENAETEMCVLYKEHGWVEKCRWKSTLHAWLDFSDSRKYILWLLHIFLKQLGKQDWEEMYVLASFCTIFYRENQVSFGFDLDVETGPWETGHLCHPIILFKT